MYKNFDAWNDQKKAIDTPKDRTNVYFREREVWWCSLGLNIGYEQNGKSGIFSRPVLIIKKFNKHIAIVVPCTTKPHKNNPYYIYCPVKNINQYVIISQVRLVDTRRLVKRVGLVEQDIFQTIKNAIKAML